MKRSSSKYSLREVTDDIDYYATTAKRTKTGDFPKSKSTSQLCKETRVQTKTTKLSNVMSYTALKADNVKLKNENENLKAENIKIRENNEGLNEAFTAKVKEAEDLEVVIESLKAENVKMKEKYEAKLKEVETENEIMKVKLVTIDASEASDASPSDRTINSVSELNSSDATVAEAIGNSINNSMVFSWLNKMNSKKEFLSLENLLVESLDRQEELIVLNEQINVPNEEMFMEIYLKRLVKIDLFLEMTFNARGGKTNIKNSMFMYCFAMSMKKKFVKVEPSTVAEQDNLMQLYKSKIQTFVTNYRVLVKANPNIW